LRPEIAEALKAFAGIGIVEPSSSRIRARLEAAWERLERRGGDPAAVFRRWWEQLLGEAQASSIKVPAAWLTAAFTRNDHADQVLDSLLQPEARRATKPAGPAYTAFIPEEAG
jgi:hypothetical protein